MLSQPVAPGKIQKLLHWLTFSSLPLTFTGFSGDPAQDHSIALELAVALMTDLEIR